MKKNVFILFSMHLQNIFFKADAYNNIRYFSQYLDINLLPVKIDRNHTTRRNNVKHDKQKVQGHVCLLACATMLQTVSHLNF